MGGAESTLGGLYNHVTTGAVFTEEHCKGLCDAAKAMAQCMANECKEGSELSDGQSWKDACTEFQTEVSFFYSDIDGPDACNGWCDMECEEVPEDCFPIPFIGPYWNTYQDELSVGMKLVFCIAWSMLGCITSKSTLRQRCEGISKEDVQGQYCKKRVDLSKWASEIARQSDSILLFLPLQMGPSHACVAACGPFHVAAARVGACFAHAITGKRRRRRRIAQAIPRLPRTSPLLPASHTSSRSRLSLPAIEQNPETAHKNLECSLAGR